MRLSFRFTLTGVISGKVEPELINIFKSGGYVYFQKYVGVNQIPFPTIL
jgi:hypothetical protein